jgi:hypothetical protein
MSGDATPKSLVTTNNQILLSTVVLQVYDSAGTPCLCRALLDSGSQSNFITEHLSQLLKLKKTPTNLNVFGINEKTTIIKRKIQAQIKSRMTEYSVCLDFIILPSITGNVPMSPINTQILGDSSRSSTSRSTLPKS